MNAVQRQHVSIFIFERRSKQRVDVSCTPFDTFPNLKVMGMNLAYF